MKRASVLIACVCGNRFVDIDAVRSFLGIALDLKERKIEVDFLGQSGIPHLEHARNAVVSYFLEKRGDYLLCLDSDMEVSPKTIGRLLQFSQLHDKPFTAAPYVSKGYDNEKTSKVFARDLDDFHAVTSRWNVVFEDPTALTGQGRLDMRNGFARAVRVGAGAMLCRRDMLETMAAHYRDEGYFYHNVPFRLFPLFNIPVVNGEAVGEDYAFCDRWRECGGELWVDTTATIRHNGHHSYRGNLAETLDLRRRALSQGEA
ncbi:glycosyltransferase family 2 protein [Labrys neptuniae]